MRSNTCFKDAVCFCLASTAVIKGRIWRVETPHRLWVWVRKGLAKRASQHKLR